MKKQSKTSLFATLRKVFRMALEAEKRQTDAQEITEHAEEFRRSRRRFLENAGKATLIGAALPTLQIPGLKGFISRAVMPRIVIVGGGIAGLNALHTLKKSGLDATIYEASNRCGGRMFTVIGAMGEGSWTEFGGEFVDTDHKDMWDLAEEFRLELIDYAQESEAALTKEAFFFNGEHYTLAQVVEEFRGFAPRMKADMDKLDIPHVSEMLDILYQSGAELYGCQLAMEMFKLQRDDLVPQVADVITAMDFIDKTEGAQIIFI